jgi:hypothetical protein
VNRLLSIIIPIQTFCQYLLASSVYLPPLFHQETVPAYPKIQVCRFRFPNSTFRNPRSSIDIVLPQEPALNLAEWACPESRQRRDRIGDARRLLRVDEAHGSFEFLFSVKSYLNQRRVQRRCYSLAPVFGRWARFSHVLTLCQK